MFFAVEYDFGSMSNSQSGNKSLILVVRGALLRFQLQRGSPELR